MDTEDGSGHEFPVAEVHCNREQAASKTLLPLLFPRDSGCAHAPREGFHPSAFFKLRTAWSTFPEVSYRLLILCMPQAESP